MKHLTDEGGKFSDEKLHIGGGKKPSRRCQESSAKSFTGNGIHVFYSVSSPSSLSYPRIQLAIEGKEGQV